MKILYFDCFSGISGDMAVGALLDAYVPFEYLEQNLKKLGIEDEYKIKAEKTLKNGIQGTNFCVDLIEHHHEEEHHHGRNLADIENIIDLSDLNDNVKNISKNMFHCVAEAEAKVHGKDLYEVHFHEVGATDSIVDIVSTAICIDYIKPDKISSSYINTGKGFVKCQHGIIPVPAPATVEILKGIPVYCDEREFELTTPTGAAIIKTLSSEFGSFPPIKIKKTGYGCGKRNTEKPNVLRVIIGDSEDKDSAYAILEATIDDMNPQIYGYLMDKLFEAGAKDVYYTPVYMKKNRPGIIVTITAPNSKQDDILNVMFTETTTIGIRKHEIKRIELEREIKNKETEYGNMKFKIAKYNGNIVNSVPEFEDVKEAAIKYNKPMKEIYNRLK